MIEPIKMKYSYKFNSISKEYFEDKEKKIRNLSKIGYRLLNFISYCHLFFTYCIGNISEEMLKRFLIKDMSIQQIIKSDWDSLKELLQQKNIDSIQIFMNLIFKKLSKKIKECKILTTEIDRENFENEIEKLIGQCLKDYPINSLKYIEKNKKQSNLDYFNMKIILSESIPITEEIYSEKISPLFKSFIITKYQKKEDFIKNLDSKKMRLVKYPLLSKLLLDKSEIKLMEFLEKFNEFENFMLENYSFKITRKDAKKRILKKRINL